MTDADSSPNPPRRHGPLGNRAHYPADVQAIGTMLLALGVVVAFTMVCVLVADYFARIAWRLGLVSSLAQGTIYLAGLFICVGLTFTIGGRLVNGRWWFHD